MVRGGQRAVVGLGVGSPDLVGLQRTVVRPEDVGQVFGRFVGLEVKTRAGRLRAEQERWLAMARRHGALVGVVRGREDVGAVLGDP